VVGLGPGGAAAAWAAASKGLRVIAIDKKRQVGVPVQCAEFIPLPLGRYLRSPSVIKQSIAGMVSVLPSGESIHSPFSGFIIDRAAFDQDLAAKAREAGTRLSLRSVLREIDAGAKAARIDGPDGSITLRYKLLIAADGPYSRTASLLGLPRQDVVHARQYTVPLTSARSDTMIWLSPDYPGGYAWLFPRGAHANLGVGIDFKFTRGSQRALDTLHARLATAGIVGREVVRRTGGAIPVGGVRPRLVERDVMFVGDAAGLTHPITGAGIAAAVTSGERAGLAAASWMSQGQEALDEYELDMGDLYRPTLEHAVRVRAELDRIWATPAAALDASQRRGWIAFEEYFDA
jgi:geranylgeranyl reductase family protein